VAQLKAEPEFPDYLRSMQDAFECYRSKRGVTLPQAFIWLASETGMSVDQLKRTYAGESFPIRRTFKKILQAADLPADGRSELERLHDLLRARARPMSAPIPRGQ